MKSKSIIRNVSIAALGAAVTLCTLFAFAAFKPNVAKVNADIEVTASVDFTQSSIYDDTDGTETEAGVRKRLGTEEDEDIPLPLFNGVEEDEIASLTFNTGTGYHLDLNIIKKNESLRLSYPGSNNGIGASITLSLNAANYAFKQVVITTYSPNASCYVNIAVTDLGDNVISDSAVDEQTGYGYATALFPQNGKVYVYDYSSDDGFKSFCLTNSRNGSGSTLNIKNISVTYEYVGSTYTVSFDTDGGTSISSQEIASGNCAERPDDPVKPSAEHVYSFGGWYADDTFETAFDFADPITVNTTVYAKFDTVVGGRYTMTFQSNGGDAVSQVYAYPGDAFVEPSAPSRSGAKYNYSFANWCTDAALTADYDWETVATENITLYAKWNVVSYTALPSGTVQYETHVDIESWGSAYTGTASARLDSWRTFDQSHSKEQIVWNIVGNKSSRGFYIQGTYNCMIKALATSKFSLSEYSQYVITYVRIELRNWSPIDTVEMFANDGNVAVDSESLPVTRSSPTYYLLQASFDASDEITSVKFTENTDGAQIFIRNVWFCFEKSPSKAKAAATAELDSMENDYSEAAWATIADDVETAKTNISAATTVSAVEGYLSSAKSAIAALDDDNLHFTGKNVALDESLALNYYVYIPDGTDSSDVTVRFSYGSGAFTKTVAGTTTATENVYKFTYKGISPHRIGDDITVTMLLYGEDFAETNFVMTDYFKKLLSMTASELSMTNAKYAAMHDLIGDICDYGAAAQEYIGYDTENLVNEDFADYATDEEEASSFDKSVSGEAADGTSFKGVSLHFDGENKLNLVFNATAENIENVTVTVTVGEGSPVTFGARDFVLVTEGVYAVRSQAVKATEFDDTITAIIYSGLTEGQTLTYSVQAYVYAKQDGDDETAELVKALWKYGVSATTYSLTA